MHSSPSFSPAANESSPLIGNGHNDASSSSGSRAPKFSPLKSSRFMLTSSWLNVLLLSVPFCLAGGSCAWRRTGGLC